MIAHRYVERLRSVETRARTGRVTKILPTYVEADGPDLPLGALCTVETQGGGGLVAEVARVDSDRVVLVPLNEGPPTFWNASIRACAQADRVPVGDGLLGRAVDGVGRPIDGCGPLLTDLTGPLEGAETSPLDRTTPREMLATGIRAIDGLLTLGRGQRVGVFAASGVGKTSLMTQLARQMDADRIILCLVGERGREVEALWSGGLSEEAKQRSVMVAATSEQPAAMRARAGKFALALAEHWRGVGHHVVLLLDSVTRLAMALREIGLAAGEPPTVRAYTPGVFAAIPKIVERCGALRTGGAISAIMTVLSETDEVDDPIAELMKSLLDGHILLSRNLAEQGHFPAIDVPKSISRLAGHLASPELRKAAEETVMLLSAYEGARTMLETGVYAQGTNADVDRAIARRPALIGFLRQRQDESSSLAECRSALSVALGGAA
ncbi:FliI/YscN family ATPase [Allosphingosinicella sp.]|jgi:flagellum-specific ATP synthase|uniref:FliI/YscN family ATPase n=1 Tax=Allosphingosinicella sp. TaxID=2823234 RepID=UPI002F01015A